MAPDHRELTVLTANRSDYQEFCYPDGSAVDDDLLVATYFDHLDEEEDIKQERTKPKENPTAENAEKRQAPTETSNDQPIHRMLYTLPPIPPIPAEIKNKKTTSVFKEGHFIIKVSEWSKETEKALTHRGNIQSKTLGAADVSMLTLAGLRKHVSAATPMFVATIADTYFY